MNNIFFYIMAAGYGLSAVCAVIAAVLFFKFDILYVIKDLKGTIAQQEIQALRKKTSESRNSRIKIYDPDENTGKTGKETSAGLESGDTEMRTSILEFNKVINKDFVIVTDIIFINTDEVI